MKNFKDVIKILEILLGENGCPWDKKQTIFSLKKYLMEEVDELKEEIEKENIEGIKEETGDVLYNLLFLLKVAKIDYKEVFEILTKKLIRRHPHIFGKKKEKDEKDVIRIWKEVKKGEKNKKAPKK